MTTTVTIEEGLVAFFKADAGVAALVGTRVRTGVARQNETRPFLVVQPPSIEPVYSAAGGTGLAETTVNIHCEAQSYADARELSETVRKLFRDGYQGNMQGVDVRACYARIRGNVPTVVSGDQEGFRSVTVELQIFHREP